jgi:NAD(P)-dependent dehydrogenase (short-subunit alcohol dehydrogenase family)
MGELCDQVAIVTGGNSGIGRATAIALAARGASVTIVGRSAVRIEEALVCVRAAQPHKGERGPLGLSLDIRDEGAMQHMADTVIRKFGRIDILVAAAGVGGPTGVAGRLPKAVVQLAEQEWDEVIHTNVRGTFLSNRAVLPNMIQRRTGNIVNVASSRGARMGLPLASAYCASKHAMIGLTEALAQEVAAYGIRVDAILPDGTDTPLMTGAHHLCPNGLLPAETVADLIVRMIELPNDTRLMAPMIAPFGTANPVPNAGAAVGYAALRP